MAKNSNKSTNEVKKDKVKTEKPVAPVQESVRKVKVLNNDADKTPAHN